MKCAAVIALVALSASAATPPECDTHALPRQIWKDPDTGKFWYCDRDQGWSEIQTSSGGTCAIAGPGDAGCFAASGDQTVTPNVTFAGDAGVGVNLSVLGIATSGKFCLSGVCAAMQDATYWTFDGPVLFASGNSGVVQGPLYFNPGGRLQSNIGNAGVTVVGNCDSADDTCADFVVNSVRNRTAGWSLKTDNIGQPYGGIRVDGTVVGGGNEGGNGFGIGRAAFQQAQTGTFGVYNGYTTLASPDGQPVVIYGSVFGLNGADTAMGFGALGAIGGPHASVIFADHYTSDGGWGLELDHFRAGATAGSKIMFIDVAGGYGEYGWNGYLPRAGLDTPIGNQRATFPACPEIERPLDGGSVQYVGVGGDSTFHHDFTPNSYGAWFFCNESDGGTEGAVDAGGGHTVVGYTQVIDAWALAHGYGIVDGGFEGNLSIDGWVRVGPKSAGRDTLSSGTKTEAVNAGCHPVCSSETANNVHCTISGSTLTATGTGTDAFNWTCL